MRFILLDRKLRMLYVTGRGKYSGDLTRAFFRVMGHIDQAVDERDLYALKGLHYEKLKGDRKGQHSLRLNDQFRLIVSPSADAAGSLMSIIEIVDYH